MDDASANDTNPNDPPGLRAQLFATIDAGKRLLSAHVNLAKAEIGEIAGSVGRMVGLFGAAIGLAIFASLLFGIGLFLFLGELLLGSIGWGMLLGTLLLLDLALMLVLAALDVSGRRIGASFGVSAILGVVVGVLLALNLTNRGWTALGDSVASAYDPSTRAVLLALGISAAVAGLVGLIAGLRGGIGGAIAGLVLGAIAGLVVGGITVLAIPAQVGAAIGVLVALIAWPILAGLDVARTGIDGEAIGRKFKPEQTIELTKETIEWVRKRTPLAPKS